MEAQRAKRPDVTSAVVGGLLLILAIVVGWDASKQTLAATYGVGPQAMPYLVAGGLLLLGAAHLLEAFRSLPESREPFDPWALALIGGGLAALIAVIAFGGGFIIATTLLFAATARAFGRRALLADLAIGLAIGFIVYLAFTKLLTLSLPQGPLERLL